MVSILNKLIARIEQSKHSLRLGLEDRVITGLLDAQRQGKTHDSITIGSGAAHRLL